MRSTYLVCYDISDDARRTRVLNTMKGFGDLSRLTNPITPSRVVSSTAARNTAQVSDNSILARVSVFLR